MTEQQDTPKILDELAKSNTAAAKGPKRKKTGGPGFNALALVLLVPLAIAAVLLAQRLFQVESDFQALSEENQQLQTQLAAQLNQLQAIQEELGRPPEPVPVDDSSVRALEGAMNSELSGVRDQFATMDRQFLELSAAQEALARAPNFEWKIMEAEYLLAIADRKLFLEADIDTARELAQTADEALLDSANTNVFAARQEISTALAALSAIEPLDRDGLYLRISNLDRQVDDIDLLGSMRQSFERARGESSQPLEIAESEPGFTASFFSFLSSVFVLREWDETPDAMLAPGQERQVKQSLRLLFEQAQLALLQKDQPLYQRSLTEAQDWMLRFKVTETAVGQSMSGEIEALLAIDIDPQLASFQQALTRIRQIPRGN